MKFSSRMAPCRLPLAVPSESSPAPFFSSFWPGPGFIWCVGGTATFSWRLNGTSGPLLFSQRRMETELPVKLSLVGLRTSMKKKKIRILLRVDIDEIITFFHVKTCKEKYNSNNWTQKTVTVTIRQQNSDQIFQSFQFGEICSNMEEEKPRSQQAESSDVWL